MYYFETFTHKLLNDNNGTENCKSTFRKHFLSIFAEEVLSVSRNIFVEILDPSY